MIANINYVKSVLGDLRAKKKFGQLDEEVQNRILDFEMDVYIIANAIVVITIPITSASNKNCHIYFTHAV